jgi:hypothetical protein
MWRDLLNNNSKQEGKLFALKRRYAMRGILFMGRKQKVIEEVYQEVFRCFPFRGIVSINLVTAKV